MGDDKVYDVIVIGAGLSGLSAAKLLMERYDLDVAVLEARDRVGGRTYTIHDPAFQYTDVGGAYVGPTQRRILRLARELGVETYCINHKEKIVMNIQGSFVKFKGMIPPVINPIKIMDLNHVENTIDKMAAEIPLDAPWTAPKAKEWDSKTFRQFLDETCWTSFAKENLHHVVNCILCVPAHEMSLLFLLWYVASAQGYTRLTTITNGAQERKFEGGSMLISTRMADLLGSRVHLNSPVIHVDQTEDLTTVTCANGNIFKARYVISASPLTLLNRIAFDPPLHPLKIQLIQRIPMGSVLKTMMYYKTAFWREKDMCGEMLTDHGPVLYCVDDTKPDGSHPCLMGFIVSNTAREMVQMTKEERKNAVAAHYAEVFQDKEFLNAIDYFDKDWMEEEYSGGCYVSVMAPGIMTSFGPIMRDPHKNVHFAGSETATCWNGYMDGAVQAGERAAREILCRLGKISEGEVDQEEPPSPEFPEDPAVESFFERALPSVTSFLTFSGLVLASVTAWAVHKHTNISISFTKK